MSEEKSIADCLIKPTFESYFDAVHNRYWMRNHHGVWTPRISQDIKLELESIGYNTKATKGKTGSEADYQMKDIRNKHEIAFAGEVAGKAAGLHEVGGMKYLVTSGPKLVEPVKGEWPNIKKLGVRLFGDHQLEFVLGWSKCAITSLYRGGTLRSQMLVLAGPSSCGKSFWQEHVISGMLGGRSADPIQYMTGRTAFNEDIIRAEHLKMEDRHSRTDLRSRRAFGMAVKELTVNGTQRAHGKGKTALQLDSHHWVSASLNDEAENLSVLPPMDESLEDKIALIRCMPAVNSVWPGDGKNQELEELVAAEMPAFVNYLLNEHEIRPELRDDRMGIQSHHDAEILARLASLSPEEGLDVIIDKCWSELSRNGGHIKMEAADIETTLHNHPDLAYRAKRILTWDGACGVYLERLHKRRGDKYIKPRASERPRTWTIKWEPAT